MEKNNDRKAPKVEHTAKEKGKIEKIKDFYKTHKWALVLTLIALAIILFIFIIFVSENLNKIKVSTRILITFFLTVGISFSLLFHLDTPKAIDVYKGRTTLEITYKNGVPIDSTVVWKSK